MPCVGLSLAWLGCRLMDAPAQCTYSTTHHVKQVIVPRTARRPHFYRVIITITVHLLTQGSVDYIYGIKPKERCPEVCQILRGTLCILESNLRGRGWRGGRQCPSGFCVYFLFIEGDSLARGPKLLSIKIMSIN